MQARESGSELCFGPGPLGRFCLSFFFFLIFIFLYLFIWLQGVFVVSREIFSCDMRTLSYGMWDLAP